jgi:hypothetical protein
MTLPDPDRQSTKLTTHQADPVIPRSALERVLARATQLQGDGAEEADGVSESRILEIAREVGIEPSALRQALAEERARLPMREEERGPVLDALGPATSSVQRVVPGTPNDVLSKLEAWMPRMESLAVKRRVGERVSWEPRHDPLGNFFRSFGLGGRRLDLVRLDQVVASVTAIDGGRSVVRFDAEAFGARRAQRNTLFAAIAMLTLLGVMVSIPVLFLASTGSVVSGGLATIGALVSGVGYLGWRAIRRVHRRLIDRAHLRLEQLLDELENGGMQPPPSLARQVTAALLSK